MYFKQYSMLKYLFVVSLFKFSIDVWLLFYSSFLRQNKKQFDINSSVDYLLLLILLYLQSY